jgi:hypothetical protein
MCFVSSAVRADVTVVSSKSEVMATDLLVERMFCCFLFMCPIAIAGVSFKSLLISSSVIPGQVAR